MIVRHGKIITVIGFLWALMHIETLVAGNVDDSEVKLLQKLNQVLGEYAESCALRHRASRYEVQIKQLPNLEHFKNCTHETQFKIKNDSESSCSNAVAVQFSCGQSSNTVKKATIKASINLYHNVVVANQSIPKDAIFNEKHLALKEVNTSKLSKRYYLSKEELIGQKARKRIVNDQIIHPDIIVRPYLVKKNDMVTVEAVKLGVRVRLEAQAIEQGRLDDLVKIKNTSSGQIFTARVLGQGRVLAVIY